MRYTNNEEIKNLNEEIKNLPNQKVAIKKYFDEYPGKNGRTISARCVTEAHEEEFNELCNNWFTEYLYKTYAAKKWGFEKLNESLDKAGHEIWDNLVHAKNNIEEDFSEQWRDMLIISNFGIYNNCSNDVTKIYEAINRQMEETEVNPLLRHRIQALCMLTRCQPEVLFCEGVNWLDAITGQNRQDEIAVKDGMSFTLDPLAQGELNTKNLVNEEDQKIAIRFKAMDKDYKVTIPAYGRLTTVFAGEKVTMIKGGVSLSDVGRCIIQKRESSGDVTLFYADRNHYVKGAKIFSTRGLNDACGDDHGGYVALLSTAMITSRSKEVTKENLPMLIYRSGKNYAYLHQNGNVDSNYTQKSYVVRSMVCDGIRGFVQIIRNESGNLEYLDFRRIKDKRTVLTGPASDERTAAYIELMMSPFNSYNCAEKVYTPLMNVVIDYNGNILVSKNTDDI